MVSVAISQQSAERSIEFVVPGTRKRRADGQPAWERSRRVRLSLSSGSAYATDPAASGKIDSGPGGKHVKHGVPQSTVPQLALGVDVTLKAEQLPELLATVAAELGGQSEDGGSYGFEVNEAWLQGERLIVHGGRCRKRGPAERASAVQGCLTEFTACDWSNATPALAKMGDTLRWYDCDARKPDSASKRGVLVLAVARLVWGGPVWDGTGSTPRPNDEAAARAFLCSPQAKDELTHMLAVAAAAAAEHLANGVDEGVAAALRAMRAKKVADAAAEAKAKRAAEAKAERAAAAERAQAEKLTLLVAKGKTGAQAEKLTLLVTKGKTGYFGVHLSKPGRPKPYQAQVSRGGAGKRVPLGCFATAEEAALCVARSPEGQVEAAKRAAAAAPLTSEVARQQAQAEQLTLLVTKGKTGYFGVNLVKPGQPKPYQARVKRGDKRVCLGNFANPEEAALCVARSPEGRAAAKVAGCAAPPLTTSALIR